MIKVIIISTITITMMPTFRIIRLAIGANLSPITMIMTMGMFSWTWCFQWKGGSVLQWMAIKIFTVLIDSDDGSFKCTWRGSIWENCRKRPRHRSPLLSSVSHSYTPHLPPTQPYPPPTSILSITQPHLNSQLQLWLLPFRKGVRFCEGHPTVVCQLPMGRLWKPSL